MKSNIDQIFRDANRTMGTYPLQNIWPLALICGYKPLLLAALFPQLVAYFVSKIVSRLEVVALLWVAVAAMLCLVVVARLWLIVVLTAALTT